MNQNKSTYLKILCNLVLFVLATAFLVFAFPRLLSFFMPFTVAWIVAWIARPIVKFIEKHLKLKRRASMIFAVALIIAVLFGLIYLIGSQCVRFIATFLQDLPGLWASVQAEAKTALQRVLELLENLPGNGAKTVESILVSGNEAISSLVSNLSVPTISAVGNFAKRVPDLIVSSVMGVLATFFFVMERENISKRWRTNMPNGFLEIWDLVKRSIGRSIGGYFKAQFKIEIWIYLLIFIGLSLLGVRYSILIALLCAFLDFLPVFGTGAVLWPWALVEAINGDYVFALLLMVIWGLSQLVRQFIQPKFVGETLGVGPIATLFLLYGGYQILGVFGMIISVPLGMLVKTLYLEGVFKIAEDSLYLLAGRLTKFRKYNEEELKEIEEYKKF